QGPVVVSGEDASCRFAFCFPTGANARAGPACTTHTGITVFTGHGLTQILVRQQVRLRIGARTAHLPEFPERIVERSDEVFGRSAPRHPDGLVSPQEVVP